MSITFIADAPASTDSVADFTANTVVDTAANTATNTATTATNTAINPATACPPPPTDSSPTVPTDVPTTANCEPVRHLLFGSLSAVRTTIYHLHTLRYADPNDWSQPISTGRPNEVMAILTRRMRIHD
ncbi:MAG: hypothetical protein WA783_15985 [Phormidesmis sp.]